VKLGTIGQSGTVYFWCGSVAKKQMQLASLKEVILASDKLAPHLEIAPKTCNEWRLIHNCIRSLQYL